MSMKKQQDNSKSIFKTIIGFIRGIITIFLLMVLAVIVVQRVTKNEVAIGGIRIFMIASESMVPEYQIGDILISKDIDPDTIKVGDDVVYRVTSGFLAGQTVTHRVIEVEDEGGKRVFVTKGIANEVEDKQIDETVILGKVIYKTVLFSFISRAFQSQLTYYLVFVVIGLYVSYQIVAIMFEKDDEVDNGEGEKEEKE